MSEVSPPPRTRKIAKIAGIVLAAWLGLALLGLGVWGLTVGFERPLEAQDRETLVTFDDLAATTEGLTKTANAERTRRKAFIDGSFEIEYDYDDPRLSISSSMNHERSPGDASELFTTLRVMLPTAGKLGADVRFVPRKDLFSGGDAAYCAAIVGNGVSKGHLLVVLQGRNVFTLIIGGTFLGAPGKFRALVQPSLDASKRLH